ncbi:hypothetical protein DSCA_32530 [Desulfosarcina alkanivorans]|uniref:Uncharacterized protein n=1 Tax=Desulfosarcina alkanivorans TaxID=571177 RepID=A0A5K7YLD5_9BACT|nr:hypothetical protein [Desulfosarcina alkanivorans]BBO69323.1 hypothetical protein DSCA_32530 [Desulfosarcina alkanivorans]
MTAPLSAIPWNTPALWCEANASLADALRTHWSALAGNHRQARQARRLLESIFPRMDILCEQACPACTDVCCQRAWVWADFRDLLFFHLAGIPPPERQLLSQPGDHCRYAGPDGCRLERLQRPFVCTWYLCPAQMRHLRQTPAEMKKVSESLQLIKRLRREMEASFIEAVA